VDWDMSPTDGSNVEANLRGLLELGKMDSIFINILVSSAPLEVPPLYPSWKTSPDDKRTRDFIPDLSFDIPVSLECLSGLARASLAENLMRLSLDFNKKF
ncbi:hypothetical protein Tco_1441485, partial [Tanacetum coccineum]